MSMSAASHAEQIAFHENALSRHPDDLPESARISHEVKLAELDAIDPFDVERREIEDQLARPLDGPRRALLEEALAKIKAAQAQHAAARLWRKTLTPEARIFWTQVHRSATVGPDISPVAAARDFINAHGTLSMSEGQSRQQDEPTEEDRIVAAVNGRPLPDPATPQVDQDRARRLAEANARAERHDELKAEAGDTTRAQAEEADQLMSLEEADPTGALRFDLSAAERAAARLLRASNEERETLRQLTAEISASRTRLDEIGRGGSTLDLSESAPAYEHRDSHGVLLTCVDSSSPFVNRRNP